MKGLMNGAPYLCSALIGCWTNPILNKIGGRRFTIFISCFMSVVTGIWMAVADSCVRNEINSRLSEQTNKNH